MRDEFHGEKEKGTITTEILHLTPSDPRSRALTGTPVGLGPADLKMQWNLGTKL